jgi:hypothetical protein
MIGELDRDRLIKIFYLISPAIYGFLVFFKMFHNGFFSDDYTWIKIAFLSTKDCSFLFEPISCFFRPVIIISFIINYFVSGLNPTGYYIFNLIFHLFNAYLVFIFTFQISNKNMLISWLASLLFAGAIGNYGDTILWICGRTEIIATFFYLSTLIIFLLYLQDKKVYLYYISILLFLLAILSKESSITLLPVLFILDWFKNKRSLREAFALSNLKIYLPFLFILIPYLLYQLEIKQNCYLIDESRYEIGFHLFPRIIIYLIRMILPITPDATMVNASARILSVIKYCYFLLYFVVPVFWLVVFVKCKNLAIRFSIIWMIISIIPYAFFTWKTTTRYLYIPSIGFVISVAFLLAIIITKYKENKKIKYIISIILSIILVIQWIVVNHMITIWRLLQIEEGDEKLKLLIEIIKISSK